MTDVLTTCMWHTDPDNAGRQFHVRASIADPDVFPGLRCVTSDRLAEVMDRFTHADWEWLAQAFLDQVRLEVLDCLDVLGFDFNPNSDDSLTIFAHILRRYDQHWANTSELVPTALLGGAK